MDTITAAYHVLERGEVPSLDPIVVKPETPHHDSGCHGDIHNSRPSSSSSGICQQDDEDSCHGNSFHSARDPDVPEMTVLGPPSVSPGFIPMFYSDTQSYSARVPDTDAVVPTPDNYSAPCDSVSMYSMFYRQSLSGSYCSTGFTDSHNIPVSPSGSYPSPGLYLPYVPPPTPSPVSGDTIPYTQAYSPSLDQASGYLSPSSQSPVSGYTGKLTNPRRQKRKSASSVQKPVTWNTTESMKPKETFVALIGKALLSSPENKLPLNDIYVWIQENYPYFLTAKPSWKVSVRHNLSVNECFVKGDRIASGRGFYWGIHELCLESFRQGNFERRRVRSITDASMLHDSLRELAELKTQNQKALSSEFTGIPPGATTYQGNH